ncbi:MAG: IS1595 family transposase [Candidatus Moeniiplasma glomeromycotorum]|nr:IS1595 family transposase [Candidatus Moeniiplasma glomeromycotorum]MCE8168024.1 IS1595 family transposase [Candidatus Moeniiplasma glomeromycotorum]MCE8169692.1 IS1595 family transposase [Candidatus Moeniiplasma glomeromycotorum]
MLKFKSIDDLLDNTSEQELINYLEEVIWDGKLVSPFDPTSKVYTLKDGSYMCSKTKKKFNIKVWTPFVKSRIPLRKWFRAVYMLFGQTGGISSYQLSKLIGLSQRTAWYMLDRLRNSNDFFLINNAKKLKGVSEGDETYMGGENGNRHWDKKVPNCQGRNWKDKIPVLVMVERGGNAIAKVVPNVKQETLEPIIRANIEEGSIVNTDEWLAYKDLGKWYKHLVVNHRKKQYAKGEASVNTAESFNACLKKGIYGTYYHITRNHAQKYVSEVVMRYNLRKYKNEQEKFNLVLNSISIGKQYKKG